MNKEIRDSFRLEKLKKGDLKKEWENYLHDNNEEHFSNVTEKLSFKIPAAYKYPSLHRICDIEIGTASYRVMRLVFHKEFIFINACDNPMFSSPGVPYWLTGQNLLNWIHDQKQRLMDGLDITELPATVWERYK